MKNLILKFKVPIITITIIMIIMASMIVNLIYILKHLELI